MGHRQLNNEKFIQKARNVHGNKYDYSKVQYIDYKTKVCIICPEHGEFWQTPGSHISYKNECPKCAATKRGFKRRIGLENFIQQANKIHDCKYDYSLFEYKTGGEKSIIICPIHGEFLQAPSVHLRGEGCPKCGIESVHNKQRKPFNEFLDECKRLHNNKYDYSKVNEDDYKTGKICIICPKHGEFWQNRKKHLLGLQGCPLCNEPIAEKLIKAKLNELSIKYEQQKTFEWLKYKQKLKLDFYLPDHNVAIECQGIQHFVPTYYNKKQYEDKDNVEHAFNIGLERDEVKYNLCEEHNIKIFYFSTLKKDYKYKLYNDVNKLITDIYEYKHK